MLETYSDIDKQFFVGMSSGFIFSFYCNLYNNKIFKTVVPASTVVITEASKQLAEAALEATTIKENVHLNKCDIVSLMAPFAISLLFDDHFLSGTTIGAGVSFLPYHPQIGIPLIGIGIGYEYYLYSNE
jgi:hypothetical protein